MLELQIRLLQIISPKRVWNIPADKFSKKSLEYHSRQLGAKKLTFTNHFSQKGLTADKSSRISQQSSVWNIPADKFFKKVSGISRQTARWLEAGFQIQILKCSKKDKFSKKVSGLEYHGRQLGASECGGWQQVKPLLHNVYLLSCILYPRPSLTQSWFVNLDSDDDDGEDGNVDEKGEIQGVF